MSPLLKIIEDQISNPYITNAELARMCNMSERSFYLKTESLTGMSPRHYLRCLRLERAKELINSGEFQTVKEIALRVGFLKVSYFSDLYYESEGARPVQILRCVNDEAEA